MTDRTKIIETITKLRAAADSTDHEAEAMNALKRAEKLMHSYRIEEAEIALAETEGRITFEIVTEYSEPGIGWRGKNRHKMQTALRSIEDFTETEAVIHHYPNRVSFTGDKADVAMAMWLFDMLCDAADRSYDAWRKTQRAVGSGALGTFHMAMASRVSQRLLQLVKERNAERTAARQAAADFLGLPPGEMGKPTDEDGWGILWDYNELPTGTGTALIVVDAAEAKREAVQAAFKERFPRLGSATGFSYSGGSSSAYAAGSKAGDRVQFNRPVGGGRALAIGAN